MNMRKVWMAVAAVAIMATGCVVAGFESVQSAVGVAAWYVPYAVALTFVRGCRARRRA